MIEDRAQKLPFAVLAVLAALFVIPLFVSPFLPFPDVPIHAGQLFIVMNAQNAELRFPEFYDVTGWLHPYTPHRIMLWPLAAIIGPEPAYRVFLALTLVGIVAAITWMLVRNGRSPWIALLCFPTLYSYPLVFGFATYCAATAALLFTSVAVEAWLSAPTRKRLVTVAALHLLVFLLHPQVFLYACVMTSLLGLFHVVRTGSHAMALLPLGVCLLPGVLLELAYVSNALVMTSEPMVEMPPVFARLNAMPTYAGAFWKNDIIAWCFYLTAFTLVLAGVLAPSSVENAPRERLWNARYVVMGAIFVAASALLPEVFRYQHYIASRMVPMAVLLVPWMLGDSPSWRGRVVPAIMITAALGVGTNVLVEIAAFGAQAEPFRAVVEKMPKGARYRCLLNRVGVADLYGLPVFDGFCSYILVEKGGFAGPQWEHTGVRFKEPYRTNLDLPGDWKFDWKQHGDWYDFFITHVSAPTEIDPGGPLAGHVELVGEEGPFRVYRRKVPFAQP